MAEQSWLAGKWIYRSFRNATDLVDGDANKARALIFGEGVYTFEVSADSLRGTLDMGGGFVLDLKGTVRSATQDAPITVEIAGLGRDGKPAGNMTTTHLRPTLGRPASIRPPH